jgi:broad specificity phosphatase PhoE
VKVDKESNTTPAISCRTEEEEFSLTDWEGKNAPPIREDVPAEFDWVSGIAGPGDDPNSFAAANPGERGICEY